MNMSVGLTTTITIVIISLKVFTYLGQSKNLFISNSDFMIEVTVPELWVSECIYQPIAGLGELM